MILIIFLKCICDFVAGRFRDEHMQMGGGARRRDRNDRRPMDNNFQHSNRQRSRSPSDYRRYDRESRDRRHKDRVKEFLKEDRY